ncbi:MAG: hypothetical protein MZV70_55975 [Desulfobacterales bacterium]|nr:hypothetical protein [Desulfobacterales bacterium]
MASAARDRHHARGGHAADVQPVEEFLRAARMNRADSKAMLRGRGWISSPCCFLLEHRVYGDCRSTDRWHEHRPGIYPRDRCGRPPRASSPRGLPIAS